MTTNIATDIQQSWIMAMDPLKGLALTQEHLRLISEIDEFKGRWQALGVLTPERLSALRRIATIESIGSSTRIEGAKLSDEEVDRLLTGLHIRSFRSRDKRRLRATQRTQARPVMPQFIIV